MQPTTHQAAVPRYFAGLDVLRAFAALSVMAFHVMGSDGFRSIPETGPLAWIRGGWVGLDIFFVISGLVVGQSAIAGFRTHRATFARTFILHRVARIVPLYLVTGVVCALVASDPHLFDSTTAIFKQVFAHLFFVHNLWSDTALAIDPPNWSLAVEMQLYALLLLLVAWLQKRSPWLVAILCFGVALGYRTVVFLIARTGGVPDLALLNQFVYQTPGLLDGFGLGVATAIALLDGRLRPPGRTVCAVLIAVGLGALWFASKLVLPVSDGSIWQAPVLAITMRSGVALAAFFLVLGCAMLPLRTQKLRMLGDLSFGVYLWHFPVMWLVGHYSPWSGWSALAVTAPATVAIAAITWRLVERPALRAAAARIATRNRSVTI